MPPVTDGAGTRDVSVPSMLDLVRLSPRPLFPPGGVDLYRQIALLTGMSEGAEVLDVACGKGISLEYFVREYGVAGSGVDVDPGMIEHAEARVRDAGISGRLQFQTGRSDALPYRNDVFDVAVGEIGLANHCSPADAVRELARVTKPGGVVVLVQLVWKAPVDQPRRRVLAEHLGARPMMLVEWKRLLKEGGVVDLHTEDWSDVDTAFRSTVAKPFPDFAELFSLTEKLGILRRAWGRWGWKGVRTVLEREREVHRLLTRERILGLDLLKGNKVAPVQESDPAPLEAPEASEPPAEATPPKPEEGVAPVAGDDPEGRDPVRGDKEADDPEVADLPLFQDDRG